MKAITIILVVLLIIAVGICGVAIVTNIDDFKSIFSKIKNFYQEELVEFTTENEDTIGVKINFTNSNITVVHGDKFSIKTSKYLFESISYYEIGGVITLTSNIDASYNLIGNSLYHEIKHEKTIVTLPHDFTGELEIHTSFGSVTCLESRYSESNISIDIYNGSINIGNTQFAGELDIRVYNGKLNVGNIVVSSKLNIASTNAVSTVGSISAGESTTISVIGDSFESKGTLSGSKLSLDINRSNVLGMNLEYDEVKVRIVGDSRKIVSMELTCNKADFEMSYSNLQLTLGNAMRIVYDIKSTVDYNGEKLDGVGEHNPSGSDKLLKLTTSSGICSIYLPKEQN